MKKESTIDGMLFFYDDSRLEFTEAVTIERYLPVKLAYRYQYVRAGKAVLRYDSAPHHPDLPTFPHHKHIGNERFPAAEPTLSQVLNEVASAGRRGSSATTCTQAAATSETIEVCCFGRACSALC